MSIRKILSRILGVLSKWAIKKHGMKLIVVAGRHGTKITGELISEMLSPDNVVRRQLERPFWDFSIPLSILGFEDRRYSFPEWMGLIFKSFLRLLIARPNFTWTILQMNTNMEEIAMYWAGLIEPEMSVFVNVSPGARELENMIMTRTRRCLVVPRSLTKDGQQNVEKGVRVVTYGSKKECDLCVEAIDQSDRGTRIRGYWGDEQESLDVRAFQKGEFMKHPLISAVASLLAFGLSVDDVSKRLPKVQIDVERFKYTGSNANGTKGREEHS